MAAGGTVDGSNAATGTAMRDGKDYGPQSRDDGHWRDFAAGAVACCGTVGIITSPSILLILRVFRVGR